MVAELTWHGKGASWQQELREPATGVLLDAAKLDVGLCTASTVRNNSGGWLESDGHGGATGLWRRRR
ncbi:hypothetical protein E2562_020588 [Oryza meyeriana var. granulata]|uniref:Uncharacterized protein n=1 Tax=Oryza meyeriana var. granulata TaxID=110450 RepID=A0A6G1DZ11_9ORYZ|nr:hypothetical protein E2562_020588 [Oryza meyeriana var. granulata]